MSGLFALTRSADDGTAIFLVNTRLSRAPTFTPTAVQIITVQLAAGDAWYTDETETMEDPAAVVNPTVVQIDEISISGTGTLPGPWTFTTDASALKATITDDGVNASPPYAVTGSTVTWIAP